MKYYYDPDIRINNVYKINDNGRFVCVTDSDVFASSESLIEEASELYSLLIGDLSNVVMISNLSMFVECLIINAYLSKSRIDIIINELNIGYMINDDTTTSYINLCDYTGFDFLRIAVKNKERRERVF
jgi:hypothetical protein